MNNTIEKRVWTSDLQLRAAPAGSDSPGVLSGYGAKFNSYSQDLGGFKERIKPGAFTRALAEKQDIRFLLNHDPNHVLARARAGTLGLMTDDIGLKFVALLPNTQTGRDVFTSISRGDITQCSFAFKVPTGGDSWGKATDENGAEFVSRELVDVDLFDVSAVTYPAYLDTSVDAHGYNVSSLNSISVAALAEARARGGYRPAPPRPRALVSLAESLELETAQIRETNKKYYDRCVAESNRPRTLDPIIDAIKKFARRK